MKLSKILDLHEKRESIFARDGYLCKVCGKPIRNGMPQLAHRIAKTRANKAKYSDAIINHPLNLLSVCSLRCNSACNIGYNPAACVELVAEIIDDLEGYNEAT